MDHHISSRLLLALRNLEALGRRFARFYRAVAILGLNALFLFVGLEVAARTAAEVRARLTVAPEQLVGEGGPRESVSYYSSQDWAQQFWHEFRLARTQQYYPYIGWRRAPFSGKTINIDQRGIRQTPRADCGADSYKVFAFGGSTIWGTGAPDWGTIPAYLQAALARQRDTPVCVTNFGETGYVSTQSVVMLLTQLQSGEVPDVAVFYDGPNDVYAAYQSGRAGVHENFAEVAAQFEGRSGPPASRFAWLRRTHSYSLMDSLVAKLTTSRSAPLVKVINYETMGINASALTDSIVRDYLANYRIVESLAREYRFAAFMFVQPIVSMGNKPLTGEEQEIKVRYEEDEALSRLDTLFYQTIERESPKYQHMHLLTHIFDGYHSSLWIDDSHVTPVGNELIAERMSELIRASPWVASSADRR